jgi:alpha-tubulin suppressor-like RCC1 family protein
MTNSNPGRLSGNIVTLALLAILFLWTGTAAGTAGKGIDIDDKYAFSPAAGWVNFNPANGGVRLYDSHLEGYAWSANAGWIRLGTHTGGGTHVYANDSATAYGVNHDGSGMLSGYAWSPIAGWVNFNPAGGGVSIDPSTGEFSGHAWSANSGWIRFSGTADDGTAYRVRTDSRQYTVIFEDFDGSQLKTEIVDHGAAAPAPSDPERLGYTFTGWDAGFASITADVTITALYEADLTDSDEDSLPDWWEIHFFGDLTTSDGTGDFDGDGRTDAQELADGTDPADAGSTLGLVAYYPFDVNADDASGNGHHGTVYGDLVLVGGVRNNAMTFDGSSNYVRIEDADGLRMQSSFSSFVWVKTIWQNSDASIISKYGNSIYGGVRANNYTIFSFETNIDENYFFFAFENPGDDDFQVTKYVNGSLSVDTGYLEEKWTYVGFTKEENDFKFYIDGVLVASREWSFTPALADHPLFIGATFTEPHGSSMRLFFQGLIDDVRIYNRALTSEEITRLYTSTEMESQSYTVTYLAAENGSVNGLTPQTVIHGDSSEPVTAEPVTGYHFAQWDDGSTDNPRTDENVTQDITVTAQFAKNQYTLTPSAGANGSISPNTAQTVDHGDTTTFTVTPDEGYTASVGGTCSGSLDGVTYTTGPITGDCTVMASFSQVTTTHTVTLHPGDHGSIAEANSDGSYVTNVAHGEAFPAVTVNADSGYTFTDWDLPAPATVTSNYTGTALYSSVLGINLITNGDFENGTSDWYLKPYSGGATIQVVEEIGNHSLKFHNPGNSAWSAIGQEIRSKLEIGKSYIVSFRYHGNVGPYGPAFADSSIIMHSSSVNSTFLHEYTWMLDGQWHEISVPFTVESGHPRSDQPMLMICLNYNSPGTFVLDDVAVREVLPIPSPPHTVTPSAGANGTINPNTAQTVNHGDTTTFTVTPDEGYAASVGGTCGGSLDGNTYTTGPITGACEVSATFSANSYTITFDSDGGSAVDPITQPFGSPIVVPADPTLEGYTFAGWSPELPETMPAQDLIVTAQYSVLLLPDLAVTATDFRVTGAAGHEIWNPNPGETVNLEITVHNTGTSATSDNVWVQVFLDGGPADIIEYDVTQYTLAGSGLITEPIPAGGSAPIIIPWTIDGPDRIATLTAVTEFETNRARSQANAQGEAEALPVEEVAFDNNQVGRSLLIGSPTGDYGITVTAAAPDNMVSGTSYTLQGTARYTWGTSEPVLGAQVTLHVNQTIYTCRTLSPGGTWQVDLNGLPQGIHNATVLVDDGHLSGSTTLVLDVGSGPQTVDLSIQQMGFAGGTFRTRGETGFAVTNDSVVLKALVYNNGNAPSGMFDVSFLDPQGQTISTVSQVSLPAFTHALITAEAGWTALEGAQLLKAVADSGNTVLETSETNNERTCTLFGTDDLPDLTVSGISFDPKTPRQGDEITITATIQNQGSAAVPAGTTVDTAFSSGGTVSTTLVSDLLPGQTITAATAWTAIAGTHSVRAEVDSGNSVQETHEDNNARTGVLTVRQALPDLRPYYRTWQDISGLSISPARPVAHQAVTVTCDIYNSGTVVLPAGTFFDVAFHADGTAFATTAITLDQDLAPGAGIQATALWDGADPGTVLFSVAVDTGDAVAEENETNNTTSKNLTIYPSDADLDVSGLTFAPLQPLPGSPVTLTATLRNSGGTAGGNGMTVEFFQNTLDPSDRIGLAELDADVPPLGGTRTVSVDWTAPATAGTHTIYAVLNGSARQRIMTVTQNPAPNLQVFSEDISIEPALPEIEDSVTVQAQIRNIEGSTATDFLVRFYVDVPAGGWIDLGAPVSVATLEPGSSTLVTAGAEITALRPAYGLKVDIIPNAAQGDADPDDNAATSSFVLAGTPVADAGPDMDVFVGQTVTLDGTGSRNAVTYDWTMTARPEGSSADLSGTDTSQPEFTPDLSGIYTVRLIVSDGTMASLPSQVTITAMHHTVMVSSTDGGSTDKDGANPVAHHGVFTIIATPDEGHTFTGWSGDASGTANPLTVEDITSDLTMSANFEINTYTVAYTADPGGSISGETLQNVDYGFDSTEVLAVPYDHYYFLEWSDGSTANPRTDENVSENITVTAIFAIQWQGDGTPENPYQVYTHNHLEEIDQNLAAHYQLMNDIDLSGIEYPNAVIANKSSFSGSFDGGGFTISDLFIDTTTNYPVGLFGSVGMEGKIRNLRIESGEVYNRYWGGQSYLSYGYDIGILAGACHGSIINCSVQGTTFGKNAGIIAGSLASGEISGCFADGEVKGSVNAGGLTGSIRYGLIDNSYSRSFVSSRGNLGGLVGAIDSSGVLENCFAIGSFENTASAGGLIGRIENSGYDLIQISNCFWDRESSGVLESAAGDSKDSLEMKTESTFVDAGWDFSMPCGIWKMSSADSRFEGYPVLMWQDPGDFPELREIIIHSGSHGVIAGAENGDVLIRNLPSLVAFPTVNVIVDEGYALTGFDPALPETVTGNFETIAQYKPILPGSGSEEDPHRIENLFDFHVFAGDSSYWLADVHVRLDCDIDLAGTVHETSVIAPGTKIDGKFVGSTFDGVFNGNGFSIKNLTIDAVSCDYVGLFGKLGSGSLVTNLTMINGSIAGNDLVGGLCGSNKGIISHCQITDVLVTGAYYVGGVSGYNGGTISDSHTNMGAVTGTGKSGGVSGSNGGTIVDCSAAVTVTGGNGSNHGGVCGRNSGTIENSYSSGRVTVSQGNEVGGFCGRNSGHISDCYSTGSVTGTFAGGFCGWNSGVLSNSYSTGAVSGEYLGGFIYRNENTITDCFWNLNTSGKTTSDGGTGLTTSSMQTLEIFIDAGWDFAGETGNGTEYIWEMAGFPYLKKSPMADFLVALHPGDHGSFLEANSGVDFVGTMMFGTDFPSVTIHPDFPFVFAGWDPMPPNAVTSDLEATATYEINGTVVAWGGNNYNQATAPPDLTGVIAISAGENHTVALQADGTVVAWGANGAGQSNVPENLAEVTAIAAGADHTVALLVDGTVVAWGDDSSGQSSVPEGLSNVTAIAAGGVHSVALIDDGTVVAWGNDSFGQSSVPEGLSSVTAIAAGHWHTVVLLADGTVVTWGYNGSGQTTVPEVLGGCTSIAAGSWHTVALVGKGDLPVYTVKLNAGTNGNIVEANTGSDYVTNFLYGKKMPFVTVISDVGYNFMGWDPSLPETITEDFETTALYEKDNREFLFDCFDSGDFEALPWQHYGNAPWMVQTENVYDGTHAAMSGPIDDNQSSHMEIAVTVQSSGSISFWFSVNSETNYDYLCFYVNGIEFGRWSGTIPWTEATYDLGSGTHLLKWSYTKDEGFSSGSDAAWVDRIVLTGAELPESYHTVTLHPGDHGIIAGANSGEDFVITRPAGFPFPDVRILSDFGYTFIGWEPSSPATITGDVETTAMYDEAAVVAWGDNWGGQATVPNGLSNVKAIAAGFGQTIALKSDGTVVVWGDDYYGQATVPDGLSNVTAIAAGFYHSIALIDDGTVVVWGDDEYGQATVPDGLSNVTAIAAGFGHTVALIDDGTVVVWGDDYYGQATVPDGLSNVTAIAAGYDHSVALIDEGTVVAWGNDDYGQATVPDGLSNVTGIAAGFGHTVALIDDLDYTLTYTAGPNGTITGPTPQTVPHGDSSEQVTAQPDTGYHFVEWSDGSEANPRSDENVTSDISVTAVFDYIKGDVNLDGKVNMKDAMLLIQYAAGLAELTDVQKKRGNISGHEDDNQAGIADAFKIIGSMANRK